MGAKESQAMKEARRLIMENGLNQYQAAKQAGVTAGAISKASWYREHKERMKTHEK